MFRQLSPPFCLSVRSPYDRSMNDKQIYFIWSVVIFITWLLNNFIFIYQQPKLPMTKCQKNVDSFLEACRKLGVSKVKTSLDNLLSHISTNVQFPFLLILLFCAILNENFQSCAKYYIIIIITALLEDKQQAVRNAGYLCYW